MATIHEIFLQGKDLLQAFPRAELEARILLTECVSLSEEQFYSWPERPVTKKMETRFFRLIRQRQQGIPLAYLTGKKEFWSLVFEVNPGVLIPRPETELVVDRVIGLALKSRKTIVDIGTGCGNIAICLAREFPEARVLATDISRKALKTARANARRLDASRIEFYRGSLCAPLRKCGLKGECDFIVSNPPYVSEKEWSHLAPQVRDFEPRMALVAGESGLEWISSLVKEAFTFLKSGGFLVFEMGSGQEEEVRTFFNREWDDVICFDDLSGIPRVMTARKS